MGSDDKLNGIELMTGEVRALRRVGMHLEAGVDGDGWVKPEFGRGETESSWNGIGLRTGVD